jgi:hypothetical protein
MSNIVINESKISKIINALNNNINNNNNNNNAIIKINKTKKLNVFTLIIEPNIYPANTDENNNNNNNSNNNTEPCEQISDAPVIVVVPQNEPEIFTENVTENSHSQPSPPPPLSTLTALEDQQRLTKDLEERRAKAEQDRIQLERERIEAEKKASQIADIANEEKERMVKFYAISFL